MWSKKLAKKLEFAMRKNYCLTEDENTSENSFLSFKNRPSCKLALGYKILYGTNFKYNSNVENLKLLSPSGDLGIGLV